VREEIVQGEYLVVIVTSGDGGYHDSGERVHAVRCNQKKTAEAIANWVNEKGTYLDERRRLTNRQAAGADPG
jgi:hypothetical protein